MRAAFLALLRRATGRDDLVVGTGVAGRQHAELEGVIGMMVNSLALRHDTSGDPTFRALLHRVRATTLEAYAWQDIPFHRVVAAVRPPRDLGCNPIFQVDFSFHDSAMPAFDVPGARGRLAYTPFRAAKFDLAVTTVPGGDGAPLLVMWQYSTDLFDEASIRALIAAYDRVLRAAVADPDRRISELSALDALDAHPAPGDDIEHALQAIWAEVLDARDVGLRDSFFERGGTSVLAARVVHLLQRSCGIQLPMTAVFHHDTVEDLARHIRRSAAAPR
jgi:non-ribosomal peptide synthetase component F